MTRARRPGEAQRRQPAISAVARCQTSTVRSAATARLRAKPGIELPLCNGGIGGRNRSTTWHASSASPQRPARPHRAAVLTEVASGIGAKLPLQPAPRAPMLSRRVPTATPPEESLASTRLTELPVLAPRGFGETSRRDPWWTSPLIIFLGLFAFIVYATWAAFQGEHYWWGPYLSPFYSPEIFGRPDEALFGPKPEWWLEWLPWSPAFLILWGPGGFRLTCYYYRGAYYKA